MGPDVLLGAQVITSLVGAIPFVGKHLLLWLRGDYAVGDATLHRFFALHVIAVPLLILGLVALHVVALRQVGSNNPDGIEVSETIPFHPYYTLKDLVGVLVFAMFFFTVVFFAPTLHGYFLEPDNFIPANPLVTPDHITPVWYMAPFFAMLRAVPDQLLGMACMFAALFLLFFLPWLDRSPVRSMRYKGRYSRLNLTILVSSFLMLGYLGTCSITPFRLTLARLGTIMYFSYFIIMPFCHHEHHASVPERIL